MVVRVDIYSLVHQEVTRKTMVVIQMALERTRVNRKGPNLATPGLSAPSKCERLLSGMDKVKQTLYAVKVSAKAVGRRVVRGRIRRAPRCSSGGSVTVGGADSPELICECLLIPFPHFISQCWRLLSKESEHWKDAT